MVVHTNTSPWRVGKRDHHVFQFGFRHLPVADQDAGFGHEFAQRFGSLMD